MKAVKVILLTLAMSIYSYGGFAADVKPGVWNTDFGASKAYAETHHVPLVVFWGNTSCTHCNELAEALESDSRMSEWAKLHPIMLVSKHEEYGSKAEDYLAAKDWIVARKNGSFANTYPYVGFYWENSSGTVVANVKFSGVLDSMPSTTPSGDLAGQFVSSLDKYFSGFYGNPRFACDDEVLSRLEADSTTKSMYVPLASVMDAMTLKVTGPDSTSKEYDVAAYAEEVKITIPSGSVGQKSTLELYDSTKTLADTTHITYVETRDCSILYPKWVGEDFDYGEWTMDYEAAKKKDGYILAMFTGTLWCPYCNCCETSLLADARFTAWAKDNKVSLVSFDQGNSSSPATAAGNGKARLLTYEKGESHITTGLEPSGAYYRSLKGINNADAAARINLTTHYTKEWLAPGSTAARMSNPTFVLVKGDKVVGRFAAYRDANKVYDVEENLARLDDLLLLAERDDDSEDYWQTTKETFAMNVTNDVPFQISSKTECYRLVGDMTGYVTFSLVSATRNTSVTFEVLTKDKTLATGTDKVIVRISEAQFAAGVYLRVTANYESGKVGGTSVFTAKVSSTFSESGSGGDDDGPGFDEDGNPCFGWDAYEVTMAKGFGSDRSFNLVNVDDAKSVSIRKVAGSLPSGVTLKHDKLTGRVILSGSPTRTGEFVVSYAVTAKIGSKSLTGEPSVFTFVVTDPGEGNPYLGQVWSNVDVPLYALVAGGAPRLAGTLSVSITKANKITAKYIGTESKTASYSGRWTTLDATSLEAGMTVEPKKGPSLKLTLSASGLLSATLEGLEDYSYFVTSDEDKLIGSRNLPSAEADYSAYEGTYTVTFPDSDAEPIGTCGLSLKTTGSSARKGKVTWSGYLADGSRLSGTSYLTSLDENHATLVVFKRSGYNAFGAEMRLTAGGKDTWNNNENGNEIVTAVGAPAYLLHREKKLTYERAFNIYGGYLPVKYTTENICDELGLSPELEVSLDGVKIADVTATRSGFSFTKGTLTSLSYTKSTGLFTGKAKILLDTGKTVTGTIRGALLVNWISCGCSEESIDRPYGSGTFFAKDITLPVDIHATKLAAE